MCASSGSKTMLSINMMPIASFYYELCWILTRRRARVEKLLSHRRMPRMWKSKVSVGKYGVLKVSLRSNSGAEWRVRPVNLASNARTRNTSETTALGFRSAWKYNRRLRGSSKRQHTRSLILTNSLQSFHHLKDEFTKRESVLPPSLSCSGARELSPCPVIILRCSRFRSLCFWNIVKTGRWDLRRI